MSFSHIDERQNAKMVNVGQKSITDRRAKAQGFLRIPRGLAEKIEALGHENVSKKGPIVQTAVIAGIMAAKNTSSLIPMCHNLPLDTCEVEIEWLGDRFAVNAVIGCKGKTGVEMEALTAVSAACLTLYDMLKSEGYAMHLEGIQLLEKTGGKSDYNLANNQSQ